jgi:proline iminopeptidase
LTVGHSELQFFYQEGSSWLFPEAFDEYLAPIPEAERHDLVLAYHAQLNSVDDETRLRAAKAWSKWEMATSRLFVDDAKLADAENDAFAK